METLYDGEFLSICKSDINGCLEATRKKEFPSKEHFRIALEAVIHQVSLTGSDKLIGIAELLRLVPDVHAFPTEAIPRLSVEGVKTIAIVIGKKRNIQENQAIFDRRLGWNTKISKITIKLFQTIEEARDWIKSF